MYNKINHCFFRKERPMQKFVIAPDSFKECLSAKEVSEALARGIRNVCPDAGIVLLPIADGGEGTLETVSNERERVTLTVTGPNGTPVRAAYAVHRGTAIVEMARAAGLMLTPPDRRHAATATTYGVGELIRHAIGQGARNILLTAGGSATNDGGCGMLAALGAKFYRADGSEFLPTGGTLSELAEIDVENLIFAHTSCKFTVATDVKNPLLGEAGATRMFAPQKGAEPDEIEKMEKGMEHYATVLARVCGRSVDGIAGAGAGGGIAVPLLAFADAGIVSGIDAVLSAVGFAEAIRDADAILTGEGKIDRQSLLGKAISGVVRAAGEVPVYAFVGRLGDAKERLLPLGLRDIYEVRQLATSDRDSMENAAQYLCALAERFMRERMRRGEKTI